MSTRRHTIGFVTHESTHAYPTQLWLGANDAAAELDLNIITFAGQPIKALPPATPYRIFDPIHKLVDTQFIDGILVWTAGLLVDHSLTPQFLARYQAVPTVSLGIDLPGHNRVLVDDYTGMAQLVNHLISNCGRRRLAFITGTITKRDAQIRFQAYQNVLQQHGIPLQPEYIIHGSFVGWASRSVGRQAVSELLDHRALQPDAIIASSDDLALGVLQELQRRGISVPAQISVTGFDNIADALSVNPQLTTVAQPIYELAWQGVGLLAALLRAKPTAERVIIPTQLVIRQSCGSNSCTPKQARSFPKVRADQPVTVPISSSDPITLKSYFTQTRAAYNQLLTAALNALHSPQQLEPIVAQFEQAILTTEAEPFLHIVQQLIYRLSTEQELTAWQAGLITVIETFADVLLEAQPHDDHPTQNKLLLALCKLMSAQLHQIFTHAMGILMYQQQIQEKALSAQIQIVSHNLLVSYDPQSLAIIFKEHLPQLGIALAYVAIRTSFDTNSDLVQLILTYDQQQPDSIPPSDHYYKAAELASGRLSQQSARTSFVLVPLYSADIDAGFVLFSFGPRIYNCYTQLGNALGYSIVNSLLLKQVRDHASQLEERVKIRTTDLVAANRQLQAEIAERKRIEIELARARDQAIELSGLKSEFLATMSHEIRTPMNGILGMNELLLETTLDDEQRDYVQVSYEESQKLLSIINSILDFSKIEAGKIVLEEAPFSPISEAESVTRLLKVKAHKKGIRLISNFAATVPPVIIGDATRFHQIIMNLVGNAVKFTETGEVVLTITCLNNDSHRPTQSDLPTTVSLQITVSDTGIGMSESTLQNLFNSFMQGDSSTTRRYGGTGLGLAITQRLITFMEGDLQVKSQLGVGSQFTVTLPYRCPKESLAATCESTLTTRAYLLISQQSALIELMRVYLKTWSIDVECYSKANIDNAGLLQLLHGLMTCPQRLHYVIIDHQSTKIEPIALAYSLRADSLLASTYLLLITTDKRTTFQQEVLKAGFDGVIQQPVAPSVLYNLLTKQREVEPTSIDTEAESLPSTQPLILVAEDYGNNQRVILAHLNKLGYAAHVVENGQAAVEAIIHNSDLYRLVLMDWQMPIMDGLEATRMIRQATTDRRRRIPIIGMTANAIKGDREQCLAAGMDDYLSKPIKREELQRILNKWQAVSTE